VEQFGKNQLNNLRTFDFSERWYLKKSNPRRVTVNPACPPILPVLGGDSVGREQLCSQNNGTDSYVYCLLKCSSNGWVVRTGTFKTMSNNKNEMKVNSSTQQFLKAAESFTPLLLNVSSSNNAQSTQTQGLYPKCIEVATAFLHSHQ
jgi:hypothetical protein